MPASRVWLVAGATGVLVRRVLLAGERVIALGRDRERLTSLTEGHRDRLLAVPVDNTDPGHVRAAVDAAVAALGGLDVVVNNAGYALPGALEELDDRDLRAQFDVNVFAPVNVLRAALPHPQAAQHGRVLRIGSIAGQTGAAGMSAYAGGKRALEGICVSPAAELAPPGINVTIVEPGASRTDFRRRWAERTAGRHALAVCLPLGSDAVAAIPRTHAAQREEIDRYRELSLSTDHHFGD